MRYEKPNMELVMWLDDMIPITQVSEFDDGQFGDYDDGGLPIE